MTPDNVVYLMNDHQQRVEYFSRCGAGFSGVFCTDSKVSLSNNGLMSIFNQDQYQAAPHSFFSGQLENQRCKFSALMYFSLVSIWLMVQVRHSALPVAVLIPLSSKQCLILRTLLFWIQSSKILRTSEFKSKHRLFDESRHRQFSYRNCQMAGL